MNTLSCPSTPPPLSSSEATWLQRACLEYQRTIARSPWIKKEETKLHDGSVRAGPHPRQQQFLLHSYTKEVFYGGAGGGGKSQALWYAALQYVDVPGYAALILRRSFADLSKPGALMDRSKEYLQGTGARWNGQDKQWTFPSGAKILFGYLDQDADKYQYKSAEFQYVAFDELTDFHESTYTYLFSRLRKKRGGPLDAVPLRVRSASNPGGRGHDWVFRRFVDPKTRQARRVFVPAKLADNPSLDRAGYIDSLQGVDPLTRQQILDGDWNAVVGGRFLKKWFRYFTRRGTYYVVGGKLVAPSEIRARFLTVDPAASVATIAKSDPDYTVISAWYVLASGELLWVGCVRLRVEVPDIAKHIAESYVRFGADKVYIESVGHQKSVAQLARRHDLGDGKHMNVLEYHPPSVDKLDRAADFLNAAEAGRVFWPQGDPTFPLEEVQAELVLFTGITAQDGHDDVWDTAGIAGRILTGRDVQQANQFAPYVHGSRR